MTNVEFAVLKDSFLLNKRVLNGKESFDGSLNSGVVSYELGL